MKLYARGTDDQVKELAKSFDCAQIDVGTICTEKPVNDVSADRGQGQEHAENQRNRKVRHSVLREHRMDKGLMCALALIIGLCLIGVITSIGGAFYLKYYRQHQQRILKSNGSTHSSLASASLRGARPSTTTTITTTTAKTSDEDNDDSNEIFRLKINFESPADEPDLLSSEPETPSLPSNDIVKSFLDNIRSRYGTKAPALEPQINSTTSSPSTDVDFKGNYTKVNRHHDLQDPPKIGDLLGFFRRLLHIPKIRLVKDY